ncbi:MAG TPA: hypothetical protein VMT03_13255 [Polyangia bacterium]|nr:hypothetical protein [Polyangia bacterium]
MRSAIFLLFALVAGCGLGAGTSDGGVPGDAQPAVVHVLVSNTPQNVPAQTQSALGPFQLPAGATVTFTIADSSGYDTMNVGVVDASTLNGLYPVAYGAQNGISSTTGTTPALAAGSYVLVVQCLDILTSCSFNLTLTATY